MACLSAGSLLGARLTRAEAPLLRASIGNDRNFSVNGRQPRGGAGRRLGHSLSVQCELGGTQGEEEQGGKQRSSLGSLDAYFVKLEEGRAGATTAELPRGGPAGQPPEDDKDETREPSRASEQLDASAPVASTTPAARSVAETKDAVALRNLDAYFEKLRPTPPPAAPAEPVLPPATSSTSSSSTSTSTAAASRPRPSPTSPPGPSDSRSYTDLEKELLDVVEQLEKKLEAVQSAGDAQRAKQGDLDLAALLGRKKEAKEGDAGRDLSTQEKELLQQTSLMLQQIREIGEEQQSVFERFMATTREARPPVAVNLFVAVNIAVFLLELATQQVVPGEISTSLPALYLSKVNGLIADGQSWRIFTAMFLHDGFFHLLIGSWILLSLGTTIEACLGPLGFAAAYVIGGMYGNFFSFIETADVTVGGTGPVYGLLGAWIAFLLRNRQAIGSEEANERLFSAIFLGVLNIILPTSLPIDSWTHIGAWLGGSLFGALCSPVLEVTTRPPGEVENARQRDTFLDAVGIPAPPRKAPKVPLTCLVVKPENPLRLIASSAVTLALLAGLFQVSESSAFIDTLFPPSDDPWMQ